MKIVNFKSGLGNQVFYYLMCLYLQEKHPKEKIYGYYNKKFLQEHNGLEIDKCFSVNLPPATKWSNTIVFLIRLLCRFIPILKVNDSTFNENAIYYDGWWQDKKFFLSNVEGIKFKEPIWDKINIKLLKSIHDSESVSLHIRRGDYMDNPKLYGGICTIEYYKQAINIISSKMEHAKFFMFSDDIEWVKQNLKIPNAIYVSSNIGVNSYLDMYFMSHCKANIIANSSFSYWGAMLNVNSPQLVIYPKKWFNTGAPDIFPKEWRGI